MQSDMSRNRQPHAITPVNNTAPGQNVWRFSSADSTTKQTTHDPGRTVQSDPRLTLILCCENGVQCKVPHSPSLHAE